MTPSFGRAFRESPLYKVCTSGRRSRRAKNVAAAFDAQYIAYQYCYVEFFIDHLCDVGCAFLGDLQAMLVLALIGQTLLNAVRVAQAEGIDRARREGVDPAQRRRLLAPRLRRRSDDRAARPVRHRPPRAGGLFADLDGRGPRTRDEGRPGAHRERMLGTSYSE
jgi:hypothetical protein